MTGEECHPDFIYAPYFAEGGRLNPAIMAFVEKKPEDIERLGYVLAGKNEFIVEGRKYGCDCNKCLAETALAKGWGLYGDMYQAYLVNRGIFSITAKPLQLRRNLQKPAAIASGPSTNEEGLY